MLIIQQNPQESIMRMQVKKVVKEVEVIEVSRAEYERINDFYKEALYNDGVPFAVVKNCNLNKMVLTNGIYHKEFFLEINDKVVVNREEDAKERHAFLEQLEQDLTPVEKEYAEQVKIDTPDPLDKNV